MRKIIALMLTITCLTLLVGCSGNEVTTADEPGEEIVSDETEDVVETTETETEEEVTYDVIPEEYACIVKVSINPEVSLFLDKDYKVVGIRYDNEDAIDAYADKTDELVGKSAEEATGALVELAAEKDYLKDDGDVDISLAEVKDESISDASVLTSMKEAANDVIEEKELNCSINLDVDESLAEEYTAPKVKVTCPDCGGVGVICPGDSSLGDEITPGGYKGCGGDGVVECLSKIPLCENGIIHCDHCGATGRATCFGCNGTGVDPVGGETCHHCGGSGTEACEYCHGQGVYTCPRCNGTGMMTCPTIDKHYSCTTCGGTGYIEQ